MTIGSRIQQATALGRGVVHYLRSTRHLQWHLRDPEAFRSQKHTQDGYNSNWGKDIKQLRSQRPRLMVLDGRYAYATTLDLDFKFVGEHYRAIRSGFPDVDKPMKILEVGAGYGRMALPLAALLTNAEITGIEYSTSGPQSAQLYEQGYMHEIEKVARTVGTFHEKHPLVSRFITGDAKAMPFADGEFDVAYTNVVIEQIPHREDYMQVFREMRRVTRAYCCFLEPWREAQNAMTFGYLKSIDYFRDSYQALREAGFSEVSYRTLDYHHNLNFKLGYAIAKV